MAVPTEAQVKTFTQDTIRIFEQLRRACAENSGTNGLGYAINNFLAELVTLQADTLVGDYTPQLLAQIAATRADLDGALRSASNALDYCLRMYAQVLSNVPEIDSQSILSRLYDDAITNSKRITSREFVFGSVSTVSASGNGVIYRENLDENALVFENQHADVKNARCLSDASSGAVGRNEEVFEIRGSQASLDSLKLAGSGDRTSISAVSARASSNLMQNPSFSTVGGTATIPTSIPGWTASNTVSASTYQFLDGTVGGTISPVVQGGIVYRDFPGDTTPYALQCLATSWSLTQSLELQRPNLQPGVPYFLSVALKKSSSGTDGTFTLTLGGSATSVALTGYSDTNWHVVVLGASNGVPGAANWYKNFNSANLSITIARSSGTTGNVTIDDVIFTPFASFDGSWYVLLGGTTQWARYDQYAWTDTESATASAQIQNWIWRSYGRYYPACPASPSAAPTVALAGAGAGNVTTGTHVWGYTLVDVNGVQGGVSPSSGSLNVPSPGSNGKVTVTIGALPSYGLQWDVYRSAAGTTTPLLYSGSTTGSTYTDNVADGSLTLAPPAGVSFNEP